MEELRVKAEQIGVMLTTKQLEQFDTCLLYTSPSPRD